MKKILFVIVIISLLVSSCSRYSSPGQGGCYFKQVKYKPNRSIVAIR